LATLSTLLSRGGDVTAVLDQLSHDASPAVMREICLDMALTMATTSAAAFALVSHALGLPAPSSLDEYNAAPRVMLTSTLHGVLQPSAKSGTEPLAALALSVLAVSPVSIDATIASAELEARAPQIVLGLIESVKQARTGQLDEENSLSLLDAAWRLDGGVDGAAVRAAIREVAAAWSAPSSFFPLPPLETNKETNKAPAYLGSLLEQLDVLSFQKQATVALDPLPASTFPKLLQV
jgi:hypothetical protein